MALLNHTEKSNLREPNRKTYAPPPPPRLYPGLPPAQYRRKAPNEVNPNPEAPEPQSTHIPNPKGP